jgi:hypothetical protein
VISARGIPVAALGSLRDITLALPAPPLGMTIQGVSVTGQGVLVHIAGQNVSGRGCARPLVTAWCQRTACVCASSPGGHLCATAPIPASSRKVTRHRYSPGGDRQASHAPWQMVITRMSSHRRPAPALYRGRELILPARQQRRPRSTRPPGVTLGGRVADRL